MGTTFGSPIFGNPHIGGDPEVPTDPRRSWVAMPFAWVKVGLARVCRCFIQFVNCVAFGVFFSPRRS